MSNYVYFVSLQGKHIKIGTTYDVKTRIRALKTSLPVHSDLRHLFSLKVDRKYEKVFHEVFAPYRTDGEWFKLEGDVLKFCDAFPNAEKMKRVLVEAIHNSHCTLPTKKDVATKAGVIDALIDSGFGKMDKVLEAKEKLEAEIISIGEELEKKKEELRVASWKTENLDPIERMVKAERRNAELELLNRQQEIALAETEDAKMELQEEIEQVHKWKDVIVMAERLQEEETHDIFIQSKKDEIESLNEQFVILSEEVSILREEKRKKLRTSRDWSDTLEHVEKNGKEISLLNMLKNSFANNNMKGITYGLLWKMYLPFPEDRRDLRKVRKFFVALDFLLRGRNILVADSGWHKPFGVIDQVPNVNRIEVNYRSKWNHPPFRAADVESDHFERCVEDLPESDFVDQDDVWCPSFLYIHSEERVVKLEEDQLFFVTQDKQEELDFSDIWRLPRDCQSRFACDTGQSKFLNVTFGTARGDVPNAKAPVVVRKEVASPLVEGPGGVDSLALKLQTADLKKRIRKKMKDNAGSMHRKEKS